MNVDYATEPEEETTSSIKKFDLNSNPNDFNVGTLFDLVDSGMIVIPDFQRNYVWKKSNASKLIESLLLGLPVPQIFLYETKEDTYQIIDGQQRMLSLFFFVKGKFPTEKGRAILKTSKSTEGLIDQEYLDDEEYFKEFRLSIPPGIDQNESELNGKNFFQINREYNLRMKTIRTIIISKRNKDVSDDAVYEIFNRLNYAGINLNSQEIRMSLGASYMMDKLKELNLNSSWRVLINDETPDPRFRDTEILLRAVAMAMYGDTYKPSMTKFLDITSEKFKKLNNREVDEIIKFLTDFIESAVKNDISFGRGAARLSVPVFESIFTASYKLNKVNLDSSLVSELITNKEFEESIVGKTTSQNSVNSRIYFAKKFLNHK